MTNKAVILAAGIGSRLFPLTKDRPKCLVDFGNQTILKFQLERLQACGFKKVVIGIGGFAAQVEEYVNQLKLKDLEVILDYNPFYYCSNNLISLWMLRSHLDEDFVLLNGDIAFDTKMLKTLASKTDLISLGFRPQDDFDDDDMKIVLKDSKVIEVSKEIARDRANGESLGMLRFSKEGAQILRKTLEELVRDKDYINRFYLTAIQRIIDSKVPVTGADLSPANWYELDFPADFEVLKEKIGTLS